MRPGEWLTIPQPRPPRPSWWERNGGAVLFIGAMLFLAALDILGI
jgi:hypothetical protein